MKISDLKEYKVVGTGVTSQVSPQVKKPLANKVADFFGAKGITEQFGADIARARAPEAEKGFVEYPKMKEVLFRSVQFGANFLPGAGVGAGLARKTAVGLGTGYAFDVGSQLQSGQEKPLTPGIGTVVGGALPGVGAGIGYANRGVRRLFKGLGSGVSGVPTATIDKIVSNPRVAQQATDKINKTGNAKVLEENAKQIMNGVSTIRQQARKAYGEGVESLAQTDIQPKVFRDSTQALLDKYGIGISEKGKRLANFEFSEPRNVQKANELVKKLNSVDLDGKSLRKLADDIESAGYKIATSDERLSFNAFIKDLSNSLKGAIGKSTDKLGDINKKFSNDI